MLKKIWLELEHHAPFTFFGAVVGIIVMVIFHRFVHQAHDLAHKIFFTLHPAHVLLSAYVTTSMYKLNNKGSVNIALIIFIGFFGSIGVATLSDSLIPYLGEVLVGMNNAHIHAGFIEQWWLVIPLALAGIVAACFKPTTQMFHSGHVFLSTWASLFHVLMAMGEQISATMYAGIFAFLFLAVWTPCCLSDIVFPLLFTGKMPEHHCD